LRCASVCSPFHLHGRRPRNRLTNPPSSAHRQAPEQVYVDRVWRPSQQMSLVNAGGNTVRHPAGRPRLGGPRVSANVGGRAAAIPRCAPRPAGDGSGVRSQCCRIRPAPPSTSVYNQSIPSRGYGYLTTRERQPSSRSTCQPRRRTWRNVGAAARNGLQACRRSAMAPTPTPDRILRPTATADPARPSERDSAIPRPT